MLSAKETFSGKESHLGVIGDLAMTAVGRSELADAA